MKIFFKLSWRNIVNNKSKTLLLLAAIALATAIMLSTISFSQVFINSQLSIIRETTGDVDLVIKPKIDGNFISKSQSEEISNEHGVEKVFTRLALIGQLNIKENKEIVQVIGVSNIDENGIRIAENIMEKHNLKIGDKIQITFGEKIFTVAINGIKEESYSEPIVMPLKQLQKLSNKEGLTNEIFIKVKLLEELKTVKNKLKGQYGNNLLVEEAFVSYNSYYSNYIQPIKIGMLSFSIIAFLISFYLVYTNYQIKARERINEYALLKTVGLKNKNLVLSVVIEGFLLSLLGVIPGIILGKGLTALLVEFMAQKFGMKEIITNLPLDKVLIVVFAIVIVSIFSAFVPAKKVVCKKVKTILQQKEPTSKKSIAFKEIIGCLFLIFFTFITFFSSDFFSSKIYFSFIIFFIFGVVFIVPLIFQKIIDKLKKFFENPLTKMGAFNLLRFRSRMQQTIIILIISISLFISLQIVGGNINNTFGRLLKTNADIDLIIWSSGNNNNLLSNLKKESYVNCVTGIYKKMINIENQNVWLAGIDDDFSTITNYKILDDTFEQAYLKLKTGNYVIISSSLSKGLNLEKGDSINIPTEQKYKKYTIAGVMVNLMNDGRNMFISKNNMITDFKAQNFSYFYLSIFPKYTPQQVKEIISEKYGNKYIFNIQSQPEVWKETQIKNSQNLFIFRFFSIVILIISVISLSINLYINIIDRKTEISIMKAVGVNSKKLSIITFVESFIIIIIGNLLGIILSIPFSKYITLLLEQLIGIPIVWNIFGVSIVIFLILLNIFGLIITYFTSKIVYKISPIDQIAVIE